MTETWYSDDKKDQYEKSYLNTVGYKIDVANRQMQTGGGIAITYRKGINLCKVKNGTTKTFEFSVWKLSFRPMTLHVVGVYRPPSFSPTLFVTEFSEFMEEVLIQYVNPIVMGDFNLHENNQTYAVSNFNNYVSSMGLKQHVTFPTHEKSGKSLDFIITEVSDGVKVLKCEPGPFFSDHCVVKMDFNVIKETKLGKNDFFRNWTEFGQSRFLKDLVNLSVHCEDVDTFIRTLEYLTGKMIDKEAAMKKKMKICRASKPCFRQNIKQSIHRSERLRGGYKLPQFQEFKTVDSIVDKARGNSKKLHSLVAELIGSQSENTIPFLENERASVEKLTDHFINTIPTIQQMLKDFQNFKPQVEDGPNIDLFKDFTEEEVKCAIGECKTKSTDLENFPTKVFTSYQNELLPFVTKLVNISFGQGVSPSTWKQAIFRPFSRSNMHALDLCNYGPINFSIFMSKVTENAVIVRLNALVKENDLPQNQPTCTHFHTSESLLLRLVNDLLDSMEHQTVTALIKNDVGAAFNTLDHNRLVERLNRPHSACDKSMKCNSSTSLLACSISQSSCLSPWLYLSYAGTHFHEIPPSISVYRFQDDHIHIESQSFKTKDCLGALKELESFAVKISKWMSDHKLAMDTSKSEFILFGSNMELKNAIPKKLLLMVKKF